MDVRDRQDALVRRLRRGADATVAQLAREVGASRRTILRDIAALRDRGFLVVTEPGRGGGVRLDPGSVQTTPRLTVAEVFALLLGVAAMRMARNLPFGDLADAGLTKIEAALPPDRLRDLHALLARLYVGALSPRQDLSAMGPMDPVLLPAFEAAFLRRMPLRFAYRDANGCRSTRIVEPQAMLVLPPLWYLVAWDPDRGDFRRFRMDRITGPAIVDGPPFHVRHVPFDDDVCPFRPPDGP
ncbi:helix-turn-helix transcriptional regulator [Jannaschia sp. LMIT008]|uniref:helix-turn-helix transcriptional regulator n=1 Tax=Jannaschia maritima TaxID=3032585 RepID=UPI002810F57A|nr:WYL domain-containing protein [Jannaschia sp. LMIT008]